MSDHDCPPPQADRLLEDLACLAPLTPDPERARRLRERCRAALARTNQRSGGKRPVDVMDAIVAPAVLGVLCVLYTMVLFVLALR
jgi:hypothetical protein